MKLILIANNEDLLNILRDSDTFDEVENKFDMNDLDGDCIVISDEYLPYMEINNFTFKNEQTIFYLLNNQYEAGVERNIKAICDSKNINLISSRLTVSQIAKTIINTFNDNVNEISKVIAFFSPVSNIGTTSTTLSVAKALQEQTTAKIGVLLINAWDQGTYQLEYQGRYLDEIKGRLANKAISNKEEFLSMFHMIEKEQLYILGGNRFTKLERLFTIEEINYLIELSKKYFDIILIDSGSHFDNAIMVQALYESDMKFVVLNQQQKTLIRFNQIYDEILYPLGYKKEGFLGIVNRYVDKAQYLNVKNISEFIDVPILTTIFEMDNSFISETEGRILYDYIDPLYKEGISAVAKPIIKYASLPIKEKEEDTKKRKKWFFRRSD